MKVINARNVNDAYSEGLKLLYEHGIEEESRNGPVLVAPWPVTTVYQQPWERVLFSPLRDANPFFHLMEALWMLAGRDDVAFPAQFNKRFVDYSDDGVTAHGAYGKRWRNWFGYDQIQLIVNELRRNPASRRCVLAMWDSSENQYGHTNARGELSEGDWTMAANGGKDVPCNTHAYVDARGGQLNLTVCCRSNDIVWGCYGANAVHFSMLQEWLAAAVGVRMGAYTQVSNNFHLYTQLFPRHTLMQLARDARVHNYYNATLHLEEEQIEHVALGCYDEDLTKFMSHPEPQHCEYITVFFANVAKPMLLLWLARKQKADHETQLQIANSIAAKDWRIACREWITRREQRKTAKAKEQQA